MVKWFIAALSSRWLSKGGLVIALSLLLASCTGRGGGWLPPAQPFYAEQATLGFSFSCERSANTVNPNPPDGRLRIELEYADHGANLFGGPFSIHGEADTLDPVLESAICIGQEPPPGGKELIFLGTYRPTSSSPGPIPAQCRTATAQCRFEVIVRDNDANLAPSKGDYFSIKLSNSTVVSSQLAPDAVIYSRDGVLGGGNITVE